LLLETSTPSGRASALPDSKVSASAARIIADRWRAEVMEGWSDVFVGDSFIFIV
jgi:hypothetical protein